MAVVNGVSHDGEEWSYHENEDTHEMVPCDAHPCKVHGGSDVVAMSLAEAYRKRLAKLSDENAGLHERIDGMTSEEVDEADMGGASMDEGMAVEILDEYVNRASELGRVRSNVYSSDIMEGEDVVRLSDGSYVRLEDIRSEFPDEAFDRLAITMNGYTRDADIAAHWNDADWLHDHAVAAMERRALEGPDDSTIGFSLTRMPSPEQWADETGKPAWRYPARAAGESDIGYYRRGARVLDEIGVRQATDHTPEIMRLYPDDDGTREAHDAHRLANMLAWSDTGCAALAACNPDAVWEHVDDDGIDHMLAKLHGDGDETENAVRDIAWRTIRPSIEADADAPECGLYDDVANHAFIAIHDGRALVVSNVDSGETAGTIVRWKAYASDVYDSMIDAGGESETVALDYRRKTLYPLKPSLGLSGEASSNGEPPTDRKALNLKLYDAMREAFAAYGE